MKTNKSQKNISNEWQLIPASDVFEFVKTYSFSRDNLTTEILSSGQVGCIHYGDIHSTYIGTIVDISKTKIPCINDKGFSPKEEELLKNGDLVMADASEDYEGVGVTVSIHGIGKNKVVGGLHTFVLRDKNNKTTEYYRQYIFRNKEIRNKLQKVANGVSVYGISKTTLSKMFLPIPAIPEQNRIVSVLETWDKSIENLNRKLEIKKQIKKGLMQDLLTGKKRLSGFKDKWLELTLGDIGEFRTSSVDKKNVQNEKDALLCNYMDVYKRKIIKNTDIFQKITAKEGQFESSSLEVGDILFTPSSETPEDIGYSAVVQSTLSNLLFSYHLVRFRPKNNVLDILYSSYCFNQVSFRRYLSRVSAGVTRFTLSKSAFENATIKIPSLKEQTAIAQILITVDSEISELEKKLSIIKEQKRYLLNNLITGTIRTPENLLEKVK